MVFFLLLRNTVRTTGTKVVEITALFCFNPKNKYAESSTVTFIEQHFKEIFPNALYDQHCIVHIQHVQKVLQALQSDLFLK